jgi:type IV fimbrial biogenesis protein FimT
MLITANTAVVKQRVFKRSLHKGFTLVELFIIIVIAGIIASIGVPSFGNLIRDQRLNTQSSDIAGAINLARIEALNRGQAVFVSAVNSAGSSNEWGPGFRVWFDLAGSPAGFNNESLEQIYLFSALNSALTLDVEDSDATPNETITFIQFNSRGNLNVTPTAPIVATLCDSSSANEVGRTVTTAPSGQVKIENVTCS